MYLQNHFDRRFACDGRVTHRSDNCDRCNVRESFLNASCIMWKVEYKCNCELLTFECIETNHRSQVQTPCFAECDQGRQSTDYRRTHPQNYTRAKPSSLHFFYKTCQNIYKTVVRPENMRPHNIEVFKSTTYQANNHVLLVKQSRTLQCI